MTRRIRLTGGETVADRARRLSRIDLAGWRERFRGVTRWQEEARWTGFVAGYLAAVDDTVTEELAACEEHPSALVRVSR